MKVYILTTYGEYGAQGVVATLDKNSIGGIFCKEYPQATNEEKEQLCKILQEDVVNPNGVNLTHGWGGWMLYIVDLK